MSGWDETPYIVRPTAAGCADVVDRATGERVGTVRRDLKWNRLWWWEARDVDAAGHSRSVWAAARSVWEADTDA